MAQRICPVWIGYFLLNPLRKLIDNPTKILKSYVKPGMTVLDFGCAMGYFSLPMARMVGPEGKIICLDIQEKMLEVLLKRARKAGLERQIEIRYVTPDKYQLKLYTQNIDFALIYAVIHEVPDQKLVFDEIYQALKTGGKVLFAEPTGHVSARDWQNSLKIIRQVGLEFDQSPKIQRSHTALFIKS